MDHFGLVAPDDRLSERVVAPLHGLALDEFSSCRNRAPLGSGLDVKLETAGNTHVFPVNGADPRLSARQGKEVTVGIRPENITHQRQGDGLSGASGPRLLTSAGTWRKPAW